VRFDHINKGYFGGELSYARLRWDYLSNAYGEATSDDEIIIDPATVTTVEQLEATLRHESCHIAVTVWHQHDEVWQECMRRFDKVQ